MVIPVYFSIMTGAVLLFGKLFTYVMIYPLMLT